MKHNKLTQTCSLLCCFMMMLAVAVAKDKKLFGRKLVDNENKTETISIEGGTMTVRTGNLTKDIIGYGGNVPLVITIKDRKITDIKAEPNAETPAFFTRVENNLLNKWDGMTVEEALDAEVDAVSGATMSSNAVINNVRIGLRHVSETKAYATGSGNENPLSAKFLCTLAVVISGCFLSLSTRFRRYRTMQLLLNVAILGLWSGSFISYSMLVGYLANGINAGTAIIPLLLVITAFIFPLFGKNNHYCNWVCPFGSLQELAGKCSKRKWKTGTRLTKALTYFRRLLWAALMLLMWTGVAFSWMDYELFTAFIFQNAAMPVTIVAVAFILLSVFIPRPYCRFVCPTGTLLRLSQNTK